MANITIDDLPVAEPLSGTENVAIVQNGNTVQTAASNIAGLSGNGTVTSVGLSAPSQFAVAGSPITSSGTLALDWAAGGTTGNGSVVLSSAVRELLTANRTYYVSTTGSDSNNGLSPSSPFLTIQKAANTASALDMSTYQVTISVGAGNYSETVTLRPWVGQLPPLINGASKSTTTFTAVQALNTLNGCAWRVENIGFANSASYSIYGAGPGIINFANVDFGGTSRNSHIRTESGFIANASGNFSISAGTSQQMFYTVGAVIVFVGRTVTLLANVSCVSFVTAEIVSHIDAWSMTFTLGSFTVTGARYQVTSNSVIHSGAGGASYFPGSTAGSVSSGGQYL